MTSIEKQRETKLKWLKLLMRPLVRFCLRHSHSVQDFIAVAKMVFLETAEEEIRKSTQKVNVSRLSAMTGLNRRDVTKLLKEERETPAESLYSVPIRVLGQWEQDPRYINKAGKPRVLSFQREKSEFTELVESISTNLHPGTVLFELERMDAVERTNNGLRIKEQLISYGPEPSSTFEILSADIDSLIEAVEENTLNRQESTNLHIRTEYDNIFRSDLEEIRQWILKEGKRFHKRVRDHLAKYDKDIELDREGEEAGASVVVNAFSISSPYWKNE